MVVRRSVWWNVDCVVVDLGDLTTRFLVGAHPYRTMQGSLTLVIIATDSVGATQQVTNRFNAFFFVDCIVVLGKGSLWFRLVSPFWMNASR